MLIARPRRAQRGGDRFSPPAVRQELSLIAEGNARMDVSYRREPDLTPGEFIDLLVRSTLAERRPIHDPGTIQGMIDHADVIVTARVGQLLVGIARAVTDFHYCTYLADLAVDQEHQRQGIGRELIRRTHEAAGRHTTLILLAAPKVQSYYPHIGMTKHESCWIISRQPRSDSLT
ncbi:MAG TPA: GNAT family N-acetyltransferase [Gemmataceae bacterium]|nr:GNAT family N-acetyltransferase [Gemmataceae bacterium]